MNYQPYLRSGFPVDTIPEPREKVRLLMLSTSVVVEGLVDPKPCRTDPRLANCLYMNQASLIIMGTACRRPLMLREAADISAAADLDVLVVRQDEGEGLASFDFKSVNHDILCAHRLWMPSLTGSAWLIPTVGEALAVRVTSMGLEVHARMPFADDGERQQGLARGRAYLSVAAQGWF